MEKSPLLKVRPSPRASDGSLMVELEETNFKITLFRGSKASQESKTTQESEVSLVNSFSPKEAGGNHGVEERGGTQQG